jgi:histidyl-tRNA synthetase
MLERAGYGASRRPSSRTPSCSRAASASPPTSSRRRCSPSRTGDRSLTLRPEGTAPICRAYIEHGMHKLPQPVKLWYLGPFFRHERPQAGRFRQFWQIGAEAIGSDDPAVDAELIVLLDELLSELGVRDVRCALEPRHRGDARRVPRRARAYLRAHEDELSEEVRERIDLNPLRAFDADHPGTREVMAGRAAAARPPRPDDPSTSPRARAARRRRRRLRGRPTLVRGLDYYTRTVFEFTSPTRSARSRRRRRRALRRPDRAARRPPTPAMGWAAGVERILLAPRRRPRPEPPVVYVVVGEAAPARAAFALAATARRAGLRAQLEQAGRSLKGQLKQADRLGARYVAILGTGTGRAEGHGERRAARRWSRRRGRARRAAGGPAVKPPRAQRLPRRLGGDLRAGDVGASRAWPAGCTAAATTAA